MSRRARASRRDDSIDVRYQLAFTIGSIPHPVAGFDSAQLIRRDADEIWMQAAVQSSLADGAGQLFAALAGRCWFSVGCRRPDRFCKSWRLKSVNRIARTNCEPPIASIQALAEHDAPVLCLAGDRRTASTGTK